MTAQNLDDKLISEVSSFYEKLKLIFATKPYTPDNKNEVKGLLLKLFTGEGINGYDGMSIGEIVSEMAKVDIYDQTKRMGLNIEYDLLFSDPGFECYETFLSSLGEPDLSLASFWQLVNDTAQEAIQYRLERGVKRWAAIINRLDAPSNAILYIRNPSLRAITQTQADLMLTLDTIARKSPRVGYGSFKPKLRVFITGLRSYITGRKTPKKPISPYDFTTEFRNLQEHSLTAFCFENSLIQVDQAPVCMIARAKTWSSAGEKNRYAIAAYVAFHNEIGSNLLTSFYFDKELHNELSEDHPKALSSLEAEMEKAVGVPLSDTNFETIWRYNTDYRTKWKIWETLPFETRQCIVKAMGKPEPFQKYNCWRDVVQASDDLFGLAVLYKDDSFFAYVRETVIPGLMERGYRGRDDFYILLEHEYGAPDTVRKPGYTAVHLDLTLKRATEFPGILFNDKDPRVEVHFISIEHFLESMTSLAGDYAHRLRKIRWETHIKGTFSKYHYLVDALKTRIGHGDAPKGLLRGLKAIFHAGTVQERLRQIYPISENFIDFSTTYALGDLLILKPDSQDKMNVVPGDYYLIVAVPDPSEGKADYTVLHLPKNVELTNSLNFYTLSRKKVESDEFTYIRDVNLGGIGDLLEEPNVTYEAFISFFPQIAPYITSPEE